MKISMVKCKTRLTALWFIGAALLFVLLLLQTFFGKYGSNVDEVWKWLLPTLMPTLSLIVGVLVTDTSQETVDERMVDKFMFNLSFYASFLYILTVGLTILIQPFIIVPSLELIRQSNLWLGPFQGLVSAVIGVFFVKSARV